MGDYKPHLLNLWKHFTSFSFHPSSTEFFFLSSVKPSVTSIRWEDFIQISVLKLFEWSFNQGISETFLNPTTIVLLFCDITSFSIHTLLICLVSLPCVLSDCYSTASNAPHLNKGHREEAKLWPKEESANRNVPCSNWTTGGHMAQSGSVTRAPHSYTI